MEANSSYPTYKLADAKPEHIKVHVVVLTDDESEAVPELHRPKFVSNGHAIAHDGLTEIHYISTSKLAKFSLSQHSFV